MHLPGGDRTDICRQNGPSTFEDGVAMVLRLEERRFGFGFEKSSTFRE